MSGSLSRPGGRGYDPRALLYNPRFAGQTSPQAIAHCASTADVAACVRFAADDGAPLRIRNGGHSYGGWSSGPGLVVDLGAMTAIRIDRAAKTATIAAGARLADVYTQLGTAAVSIGGGSCPTVGITGLTLGGGVGVLARSYGLTCDQVHSFGVVTADGRLRTVDAQTDANLFWALRGGGGSFAAVTALTFDVRPAPTIHRFFLQWNWSAAAEVLDAWQHWSPQTPRELWSTCKLLASPGKGARPSVSGTWAGSGTPDTQLSKLLKGLPKPTTNFRTGGVSYLETMLAEAGCSGDSAQVCITDALKPANRYPFAASSSIVAKAMPSAAVTAIVDAVQAGLDIATMVEGGVSFDSLGGAVGDAHVGDTAFPWRTALADVQYTAAWRYADATKDPAPYNGYVQRQRSALEPWLGNSAYVNYADATLKDYPTAYWGPNLTRLREVKKTYDPRDVFSFPQAVPL